MTVTLIILGVLAIAALAVTFGCRHSIRQERLTIDSEPESESSSGAEGRESESASEGRDEHRDVVDRGASAAAIVDAKPLDDDLLSHLDSERVDTQDIELERAPDVASDIERDVEPVVKARLRDRLGKTRATLSSYLKGIAGRGIDATTWDDLEEALLLADVGLDTTEILLDAVKARVKEFKVTQSDEVVALLRTEIESLLDHTVDRTLHFVAGELNVWMFVGVNGVGKTTSIGKFAAQHAGEGRSVLLAAGDTFRAAAAEQLGQWAVKSGADLVRGQQDADPGSVLFDAMASATSKGIDVVLVDTAGRLHNKSNLMAELEKLKRIIDRNEGALKEVLLVLDATTGQNGVQQAKQFAEVVNVSGIVLTKLDGSAKGGIVLAIQHELGIPVKAVGVGETIGDLIDFDPKEFAAALFDD